MESLSTGSTIKHEETMDIIALAYVFNKNQWYNTMPDVFVTGTITIPRFKIYRAIFKRTIRHIFPLNVNRRTIEVYELYIDLKQQNKGYGSRFITALERLAQAEHRVVFYRNVYSSRLEAMLKRRGYMEALSSDKDFFKIV